MRFRLALTWERDTLELLLMNCRLIEANRQLRLGATENVFVGMDRKLINTAIAPRERNRIGRD